MYKMPKYSFRKKVGRVVRRVAKAGVRYAKRRYVNKQGNLRLGKIAKDVAMVKRLINVEKKRRGDQWTGVVGQVNGAGSGAVMIDITCNVSQGLTASTRTGNSIKLTGLYMQGQFIQQTNAQDSNKFSVEIWAHKNKEVTMSLSSTGQELYNVSPFSGQMDLVSRRNQDYYSDYVCLGKRMVYIKGDTYATNVIRNANFNMGLKLNRHIRWDDAGTLINGQYFLVIRAQNGNASATTTSTANIPHTGVSTGYTYGINLIQYYVDN